MNRSRRQRLLTRLRAEGIYLARALRLLLRPMLSILLVGVLGALVHHRFGALPGEPLPGWRDAVFVSYTLLLLEHIGPIPPHPLAQLVHYLQPILGILLFSEGILKLGYTVFNKQDNARSWVEIMAKASRDHIIVCGLGNVGFRVLENLVEMGLPVFAIERDEHAPFIERARELDAHVIVGDARATEFLEGLNLEQARAVIVATDDDLANLEIALDVRELRPDIHIVLRLFDQRLAQKVKSTLGFDVSVSTSQIAAPLLASAALDPSVVGTHLVGDTKLVVVDLQLKPGGQLATSPAALKRDHRCTVLASRSASAEGWCVHPAGDLPLAAGDNIQVLIESWRVAELHGLNGAA